MSIHCNHFVERLFHFTLTHQLFDNFIFFTVIILMNELYILLIFLLMYLFGINFLMNKTLCIELIIKIPFQVLMFSDAETSYIFKLLSGILHLGNVKFKSKSFFKLLSCHCQARLETFNK